MAARNTQRSAPARTLMMLLDSNIIIYAALNDDPLIDFIGANSPFVSDISRVEVLGFQKITDEEIKYFNSFFESTTLLAVTEEVILESIRLRQKRKIALGDSLIAATAIINGLALVTNNTEDFKWISDLQIINPLDPD